MQPILHQTKISSKSKQVIFRQNIVQENFQQSKCGKFSSTPSAHIFLAKYAQEFLNYCQTFMLQENFLQPK